MAYNPTKSPISLSIHPLFWLGFFFTGLSLIQLDLVRGTLSLNTFLPLLVWTLCAGISLYVLRQRSHHLDPILWPLTLFLSGLGLALIARLAPAFITRQMIWLMIATVVLLLVVMLPRNLNWLRQYKFFWMTAGILLLSTTLLIGVNPSGFGARLWLQFGGFFFQPSEPLKLCLIIFLAAYLADRRRELVEHQAYLGPVPFPHPSYIVPITAMWGLSIIILIWQRDLGAALLFFGTFLGMLYAATGQRRYLGVGTLLFIAASILGYILFDVVQLRVEAFLNPWADPAGRSFQIVQSLLAFASGGFLGQGLGQGLPTAIPVVHTDFVFAAIGEEFGLLGALGILLCFVLFVSRAFIIGLRANNGFEQLLAIGIGMMMALQTLIITAGTLKLMPLTGVTLPFVSYGGSSLVTSFVMVGLLIYISGRQSKAASPMPPLPHPYDLHPYLRLAQGLFFSFAVVAGGLVLWQIVAAPFLIARSDNPRPIIEDQTVRRGRLLTADGVPVAETIIGEDGLAERRYPYPGLASVTGYQSIRYGVGGTEATFDQILRGLAGRSDRDLWLDELLHRPRVGQDVTLSINLPAQVAADVALNEREGAVVVMELETGAILVMSSRPTYDPNLLDEQWDVLRDDETAPLLNRATQGLFPLGEMARLVGLIGLYESQSQVPANPMNTPLETLLAPLGETGYLATAHQLGVTRPLPNVRSQAGLLPDFDDKGTVRDLAVTPVHLARIVAALELDGILIDPVLSRKIMPAAPIPAIRPDTSRRVRGWLAERDEMGLIGHLGIATPEETGKGFLSWFVGLTPAVASPPPLNVERDITLEFDPNKIVPITPEPSPTAIPQVDQARYVVVVVVAIEDEANEAELSLRVARSALQTILEQGNE